MSKVSGYNAKGFVFYVVVAPGDQVWIKTARKKRHEARAAFEEMTGKSWDAAFAEGFSLFVMRASGRRHISAQE